MPVRELTYTTVSHPDELVFARKHPLDPIVMLRVDDVFTEQVTKGDPVLGWEGDSRLAVYMAPPRDGHATGTYELCRLEHDGTYRSICRHAAVLRGPEIMVAFVRWLIAHDTRRGYDPNVDIDTANAKATKAHDDALSDWARNDLADRLHHAMRKDGLHNIVTGAA